MLSLESMPTYLCCSTCGYYARSTEKLYCARGRIKKWSHAPFANIAEASTWQEQQCRITTRVYTSNVYRLAYFQEKLVLWLWKIRPPPSLWNYFLSSSPMGVLLFVPAQCQEEAHHSTCNSNYRKDTKLLTEKPTESAINLHHSSKDLCQICAEGSPPTDCRRHASD